MGTYARRRFADRHERSDLKELGTQIKERLTEKGEGIRDIADQAGVAFGYANDIKNDATDKDGNEVNPTMDVVERLKNVVGSTFRRRGF